MTDMSHKAHPRKSQKHETRKSESSALLIEEQPRLFIPALAVAIGLNEAIFLQQLKFLSSLGSGGRTISGRKWIWNTLHQWREVFPFWSAMTIRRVLVPIEYGNSIRQPFRLEPLE